MKGSHEGGARGPVRHEAPMATTRLVTTTIPPVPNVPLVGTQPQLLKLQTTCVEVFRRADVKRANALISEILGTPAKGDGRWGAHNLTTYRWEIKDRSRVLERTKKSGPADVWKFPADSLDAGIDSISLTGRETVGVPFYILTLNVHYTASYWSGLKPSELGAKLPRVTHPIRIFLESLGGLVAEGGGISPRIPCVTWAGVATTQDVLNSIVAAAETEPRTVLLWERRDAAFFGDIPPAVPEAFPFRLERDYRIIQRRSILQLAGNVIALFGLSDQFGFLGQTSPYCLTVSSTPDLLLSRPAALSESLSLPSPYPDFIWNGASSLVTIIALHIWLRALAIDINRLEASASGSRHPIAESSTADEAESLAKLTTVAIDSATIASDLGLVERSFVGSLKVWAEGTFERTREIPGHGEGVLGALAQDTLNLLTDQKAKITGIRDEATLLVQYSSDRISLESNKALGALTAKVALYGRLTVWLTGTLVALTTILAVLTYYLLTR